MSKVGELDRDVMDCGDPQHTWQEMVKHLRWRAANSSALSRDRRKDADDAAQDVNHFAAEAADFTMLADALERASVTFPAQADRNPEGHDPADGRGRNDESPVGNADAPKPHHHRSHS